MRPALFLGVLVVVLALGTFDAKVGKYNRMVDSDVYPFIHFRGIKIFLFNQYEQAGHGDKPPMGFDTMFGEKDTPGGIRMRYKPDVVVIA